MPRLEWAVERATLKSKDEFAASEFLIDYGPLEKLVTERGVVRSADEVASKRQEIRNTIVLVGRATLNKLWTDSMCRDGEKQCRGLHARRSDLHVAPIAAHRFTHFGRVAADA